MIEKIKNYYMMGPQKKYFLLKVAVSIHKGKRTLMHALAIPTNTEVPNLKRMEYENGAYAEFLLKADDFFDLILKKEDEICISNFIIPFNKNCIVDDYFIPSISDVYGFKKPYRIFRIRIGNDVACYGSLSHPNLPSYSNCYDLIEEKIGIKLTPMEYAQFCVLFPQEKARISNFKIKSNIIKFQVEGNLNSLICKYNIETTKTKRRKEIKLKRKNSIRYKGKIREFGLVLWYGDTKIDYVTTRHIEKDRIEVGSYYNLLNSKKKKKFDLNQIIMNPWVISIISGIVVGLLWIFF